MHHDSLSNLTPECTSSSSLDRTTSSSHYFWLRTSPQTSCIDLYAILHPRSWYWLILFPYWNVWCSVQYTLSDSQVRLFCSGFSTLITAYWYLPKVQCSRSNEVTSSSSSLVFWDESGYWATWSSPYYACLRGGCRRGSCCWDSSRIWIHVPVSLSVLDSTSETGNCSFELFYYYAIVDNHQIVRTTILILKRKSILMAQVLYLARSKVPKPEYASLWTHGNTTPWVIGRMGLKIVFGDCLLLAR